MRKFKTGILIRNNRLRKMQDNGLSVEYDVLSNDDYIKELRNKLKEECLEVLECKTVNEIKAEVADVLEVVEHLTDFYKIDFQEIIAFKEKKQKEMGGYSQRIKTLSVSMPDGHEELEYYLSKPHKYPEVLLVDNTQNFDGYEE